MATKAKARRKKAKPTVSLSVVAGFAPLASNVISAYQMGGIKRVLTTGISPITGWDGILNKPDLGALKLGWLPIGLGILLHKVASKVGINRQIARAGIPFVRL